jgi:hypothetical protein
MFRRWGLVTIIVVNHLILWVVAKNPWWLAMGGLALLNYGKRPDTWWTPVALLAAIWPSIWFTDDAELVARIAVGGNALAGTLLIWDNI